MTYKIGMECVTGAISVDDENLGFQLALRDADVQFLGVPRTTPSRIASDARRLIEQEKVSFLLNFFGGPESNDVANLANECQVPYLFPHTFLLPAWPGKYVFSALPPYRNEVAVMGRYLRDRGLQRIAVLGAANRYGEIYEKAFANVPGKTVSSHKPDSLLEEMRALREQSLDAVVLALYPYQARKAMQAKAELEWHDVELISAGPLTDEQFLNSPDGHAEGVVGFCYFPDPVLSKEPGIVAYREAMAHWHPGHRLNRYSLFGWLYGRITNEAIQRAGSERADDLGAALESFDNWGTGGITPPVSFSAANHHAQYAGLVCRMEGGRFVPISSWELP